jgi:hypothetical protein
VRVGFVFTITVLIGAETGDGEVLNETVVVRPRRGRRTPIRIDAVVRATVA